MGRLVYPDHNRHWLEGGYRGEYFLIPMQLEKSEPATPAPTWQIVFTNPRMHTSAVVATFAIKKHAHICYSGIASLDPDNRTLYALKKVER